MLHNDPYSRATLLIEQAAAELLHPGGSMANKTVGEFWRDYFLTVLHWATVPTQVNLNVAQEFATWLAMQPDFKPDPNRQA